MTLSKALGNGFPIAAFIATDTVAASYTRPGASTYGGNPVCAAAALAAIAYHREHRLAERSATLGARLLSLLEELSDRHPSLSAPRGLGLMIGVEVVSREGEADPRRLDAILEDLKDRGFLCGKTGPGRNVLTFMPPLIIDRGELESLVEAVERSVLAIEVS